MTRLVIALGLVLLLVPVTALAAPRFGVEAGGTWTWIEYGTEINEDSIDFEPRLEFNAAATVHFDFTPRWGLTTGLRYSRLGDDVEGLVRTGNEPYGNGTQITLATRHEYLGVPLLARLSFDGNLGPFLIGGAEAAWLIRSTLDYGESDADITDRSQRYNVTAVLGAGLEIGVGGHSLELAARYGYGLVDIAKHGNFPYASTKEKSRELAITLGFRL